MATFDSNEWYMVNEAGAPQQSMLCSPDENGLIETVIFASTNSTILYQHYQIYPLDNSKYIIRARGINPDQGKDMFFGSTHGVINAPGNTVPQLKPAVPGDNSIYWTITPWLDGSNTFYLWNDANGSDYRLTRQTRMPVALLPNVTAPQTGQHFSFLPLYSKIDDARFSSIPATATSTSTTIASTTSAALSRTSSTDSTSYISTSTPTSAALVIETPAPSIPASQNTSTISSKTIIAAIAGSVGGMILIAGIVIFLLIRKIRKRSFSEYAHVLSTPPSQPPHPPRTPPPSSFTPERAYSYVRPVPLHIPPPVTPQPDFSPPGFQETNFRQLPLEQQRLSPEMRGTSTKPELHGANENRDAELPGDYPYIKSNLPGELYQMYEQGTTPQSPAPEYTTVWL